jgi:hypothetical protein
MDEASAFDVDYEGEIPDTVDQRALDRMRRLAWFLDDCMRVPGTEFRFGFDPVVSVLPVVGDAAATCVSLYIVAESANLGVGYRTLARMLANLALDFAVGSVPVLGTVFDFLFKANDRNIALALADLAEPVDADTGATVIDVEVEEP